MNKIYIELRKGSSSKTVERSLKKGNTYIFFVNENFDVKNRNDSGALIIELNYQLKKDGIDSIQPRDIERELSRLIIGRRIDIKIN